MHAVEHVVNQISLCCVPIMYLQLNVSACIFSTFILLCSKNKTNKQTKKQERNETNKRTTAKKKKRKKRKKTPECFPQSARGIALKQIHSEHVSTNI